MNAAGAERKRLTENDGSRNSHPAVSPDARYIAFASNRTGNFEIWRMNMDGSGLRQLTHAPERNLNPAFSPDGAWIVFDYFDGKRSFLCKMTIDGGAPARLTDSDLSFVGQAAISPDGKQIAFGYHKEGDTQPWRVGVIQFAGDSPMKSFYLPAFRQIVHWTPDSKHLTYMDENMSATNIWRQSLDGGAPEKLTDFRSERIMNFAWSPDGKQLSLARGNHTSDAALISRNR